ncbi:MAG: antitoxin VbhA family protein [Clostridia bacterium]|nr:antitoxin VbhA family protein [Clostridia bacterium]
MGLFDEYNNHPDKAVRERANNWGAAIGLQDVDGLSVSEFLIQLARQQIEGEITMDEVTQRLNEHYGHNKLYSSTYEIVPPNSEMIKRMKEENKLRRPKMYEQDSAI